MREKSEFRQVSDPKKVGGRVWGRDVKKNVE